MQLTPAFAPRNHELEDLDRLLEALAPNRVAIELRHRGWVSPRRLERTLSWFSERAVAFVCVDAPPGDHVPIMPSLDAVTCDGLAYLSGTRAQHRRLSQGNDRCERFGWRYDDAELEEIGGRARELGETAAEVHVMFNNNRDDDAPTAAQRLRVLLGQAPPEEEQLALG